MGTKNNNEDQNDNVDEDDYQREWMIEWTKIILLLVQACLQLAQKSTRDFVQWYDKVEISITIRQAEETSLLSENDIWLYTFYTWEKYL